ncbi:MAG: hypothetical protein K0Q55_3436 [Verrucomicrobia bacterium]|jgi:Spy/CpxP family protein refolding chaperone|nr:hypothetical protein [Verrucomicrobiota bacterium]
MSFLRHWKIAALLAALFVVGVVTGAVLTIAIVKKKADENDNWQRATYQLYKKRLKLTPEQEQRLKPAFELAGEDFRAVRRAALRDILDAVRRVNVEVEKELTPEQKVEFDKLREDLRKHFEDRRKDGKQS